MYFERILTLLVEATQKVFDDEHPNPKMRNLSVHTEYPRDEASYPGIWVDWAPTGPVQNVGIGHVEMADHGGGFLEVYRWRFSGVAEFTLAAMTNLERAQMLDAMSQTIAFGLSDGDTPTSDFRKAIEVNDLVGVSVVWESFTISGLGETPGTPWGTDDVMYEATISLTMEGEFAYAPNEGVLVPLAQIVVTETLDPNPAPPTNQSGSSGGWV